MIRYTEQERKLILNHRLSPQKLSKMLGRSVCAIGVARTRLRKKLGVKAEGQVFRGRFRPYWSRAEDLYLMEYYPKQDIAVTANELKYRTPKCIRVRASKLGVRRRGDSYFNAKRFGEVFGVSCSTVRNWISRGLLSASKGTKRAGPNFVWVISSDELLRFLKSHKEAYDPNRVKGTFPTTGDYLTVREASKSSGYCRAALTSLVRRGKLAAYKGFGPAGHFRWYIDRLSLDSLRQLCPTCQRLLRVGRKYCNHECYLAERRRRYYRGSVSPKGGLRWRRTMVLT